MKRKILTSSMFLLVGGVCLANTTLPGYGAPIDAYQVVLIVAAVLLTVGVVAYKKLSLKKA